LPSEVVGVCQEEEEEEEEVERKKKDNRQTYSNLSLYLSSMKILGKFKM
jgi:hypothetical protein